MSIKALSVVKQSIAFENNRMWKLPRKQHCNKNASSRSTDYFKAMPDDYYSIFRGKAVHVIITKSFHFISRESVTRFLSISPLQWVTNRALSRGRLKATRCWVTTTVPEPQKKRPLHLEHRTRAHYVKVKSRPSQVFGLRFVFGLKAVYSTSCSQQRGQCMWFAAKMHDKFLNGDSLTSR